MNVVDSSGWLEYFADGPHAEFFAPVIQKPGELLVPSISIYEVFKRILQQRGEGQALRTVAAIAQGRIVDFDLPLALRAGKLSCELKLPMADSIMLATTRAHGALLWTQDAYFEGLDGVRYIRGDGPKR